MLDNIRNVCVYIFNNITTDRGMYWSIIIQLTTEEEKNIVLRQFSKNSCNLIFERRGHQEKSDYST